MASPGFRNFELKLGRLGLAVFIFGASCLVFVAFFAGVMVGKNIEAYPDRISGSLPGFFRQKAAAPEDGVDTKKEEGSETQPDRKAELNLTFYDTLAGKKEKTAPPPAAVEDTQKSRDVTAKDNPKVGDKFLIQVAALKDEKKAGELRKKLLDLGYPCEMDIMDMTTGGKFYRVKIVGFEGRADAEKTAAIVEKKTNLKCMVMGVKQ
ncbi:MAG: SPOR domain-containing protein [Syntrophales bacterium]